MIAYLDCFSGISGDMFTGAFLDAGVPFEWLKGELEKLSISGYKLRLEDVKRGGIGGGRFNVSITDEENERTYADIETLITKSSLPEEVIGLSLKVFKALAEAEARVHRMELRDVHFHEVGSTDSVIDIVSAALCIHYFHIGAVYASPVPICRGSVNSSHGLMPLPAPATMELLKGIPVYPVHGETELVTPTGAAILSALTEGFGNIPAMRLKCAGFGAGSRDNPGMPNMLRVLIGEVTDNDDATVDAVSVIEADIDDMNPEYYGYVTDKLLSEGAKDVVILPVYMKKGRPGSMLKVVCLPGEEDIFARILFTESTTIGVRYSRSNRIRLKRRAVQVQTKFGIVRMKVVDAPGRKRAKPEYEDCRNLAQSLGIPLMEVFEEAIRNYEQVTDESVQD